MKNPNERQPTDQHPRLERLAWLLDSAVPIPLVGRLGLDSVLGLIPGLGDILAALLSGYILVEGARLRVPASVLGRMGLNVVLDTALGAIPLVGDLFDVAFRSNLRNVRLLQRYAGGARATRLSGRLAIGLLALSLMMILGLSVWGVLTLLGAIWVAVFG